MIYNEIFTPFLGVVESVDDPEKMGRMQVRIFGVHPRNKGEIPTEDLCWLHIITSNSTSVSGIGHSPDYQTGATVFGYLIGRDHQQGFIIGAMTSAPEEMPNGEEGFYDPDEELPYYEPNESDVNRLARDPDEHWMPPKKAEQLIGGVDTAMGKGGVWSEPEYENTCIYPMNKVYETTRDNHIREYDDTPGSERIHEWHKQGTYYEVKPDGTRVLKVMGDGYELVVGDKNVYVKGTCNVTIDANCNTLVKGDWNIEVMGDVNKYVHGNETVMIDGYNLKDSGVTIDYKAPTIHLNTR